jgi:hypothetical protein
MDIKHGSPVDKAGVEIGDILLSINSVPFTEDYNLYHIHKAGETLSYCVLRNSEKLTLQVVLVSYLTEVPGYFQSMYALVLLLSIGSFYILYKKPKDKAARIFFIYLQLFAIMQNAKHLYFHDPTATVANVIFIIGGSLSVSALIHFHLLFPRPSSIYSRN